VFVDLGDQWIGLGYPPGVRSFEELTNAGKARRLRVVAAAALERYDLRVRRLRLITNEFNAVFRVDAEAGRTFVLRVNLPNRRSLAEIEAELRWLNALATETAVGVPSPVLAHGGDLVVTASATGIPEPRHCVLFRWIDGVDLAARLTERNVAELGALTAQLHQHALSFDPPAGLRRWDNPFPLDDRHVLLEDGLVSPSDRATFATALDRIEAVLERLSDEPPRMIHGDLHQDNVRVASGRLFAIDFDDSLLGHPVQDIGATFWNLQEEPHYEALRHALRSGYERHLRRRPSLDAHRLRTADHNARRRSGHAQVHPEGGSISAPVALWVNIVARASLGRGSARAR
jgi:Ser/Thr protein kinase RdoA (MazF antagonist)